MLFLDCLCYSSIVTSKDILKVKVKAQKLYIQYLFILLANYF